MKEGSAMSNFLLDRSHLQPLKKMWVLRQHLIVVFDPAPMRAILTLEFVFILALQIRPLFEEHGNVIEVAFIKDKKTGEQRGMLRLILCQ